MNIKNYTSTVPVERTVARIESLLASFGVKAIAKQYEDKRLAALTFQIAINDKDLLIRLPASPNRVLLALRKTCKRPRADTLNRLAKQADRTAWRLQQEWLEIELTKIMLDQSEPLEVFLPYVWDGASTFYGRLKESGFKLLPASTT